MKIKPIVLLILDGWGLSPSWGGNAVSMNNPKNMENYWRLYPHGVLQALSTISDGEIIGDSRLGHTMIGTGRRVMSNFAMINKQITSRAFFRNPVLVGAINWAKKNNSNLHLIGLVSDGGVHSHMNHLLSLLDLAKRESFNRIYVDMISDGTDSGSTDALRYVEKIEKKFSDLDLGQFSSIGGRYWAMDRDNQWNRISTYFKTLTEDSNKVYPNIKKAITANYRLGNNDEFISPGLVADKNGRSHKIDKNDAVIFFNFREDRSRELTRFFVDPNFRYGFHKPRKIEDLYFATFINYENDLTAKVVFGSPVYENGLAEVLAKANFKQLKIAESQKYAHVTYFFNGGSEDAFAGEDRKIVPSVKVDSFDKIPEMSAKAITSNTINAMKSAKYDLIVVNFANVDMIAHTGNILATGQAITIVDEAVKDIVEANLKVGGATIITADHGNAEQMVQLKGRATEEEKTHTINPVPFILVAQSYRKNLIASAISHKVNSLAKIIQATDTLADIAPTILELMQLPKPAEMTGRSLIGRLE